jgi:transcriptional antiterminator NusG
MSSSQVKNRDPESSDDEGLRLQTATHHEGGESSALDLTQYVDARYKWYIVNTYSGSEDTVKLSLEERIIKAKLQASFGIICVPKRTIERVLKSGKKKIINKTSFPGYILVQMELNDQTMGCVVGTPKVTGFVGGNRKEPRPMHDEDVLKLMNPEAYTPTSARIKSNFDKGETIKVIDGPFTNFDGVIEEVRADKMKLKVLVSIFGRETPVELNYVQVQKI